MKFLALFLFIGIATHSTAQFDKSIYFEALGSGGLGSFNFEKILNFESRRPLAFRAGLSFLPIDKNNGVAFVFPIMVHGLIPLGANDYKSTKHIFDIGLGQAFTITTKGSFFLRAPVSVGYRFQNPEKRPFFRISYTPIISYLFNVQWEHWGGLTCGIRF